MVFKVPLVLVRSSFVAFHFSPVWLMVAAGWEVSVMKSPVYWRPKVGNFPPRRDSSAARSWLANWVLVPLTIKANTAVAMERATEPPKLIFPAIVIIWPRAKFLPSILIPKGF